MNSGDNPSSNAQMSGGTRTKPVKRLTANQRVSACVGAYITDEANAKTKKKQRLYGFVVKATAEKKYLVKFDNLSTAMDVASNCLRVESPGASLPPDMPAPVPANPREASQLNDLEETIEDQDDDEHLPEFPPEHEEAEEESNENAPSEEEAEGMFSMKCFDSYCNDYINIHLHTL
jgi:hypothetical protein